MHAPSKKFAKTTSKAYLAEIVKAASKYAKSSRSAATWRAYESDWRTFQSWCGAMKLQALPAAPSTVAVFLAAEAKQQIAPATLGRRLAAIRLIHLGAKYPSPHDALEVPLASAQGRFTALPVIPYSRPQTQSRIIAVNSFLSRFSPTPVKLHNWRNRHHSRPSNRPGEVA
jgi:hypothetical protein